MSPVFLTLLILLLTGIASAQTNTLVSYYAGTNGVAPDPISVGWTKSGTGGTVGGISPDGAFGLNAWNVNDNTTGAIGQAYNTNLTAAQRIAEVIYGWLLQWFEAPAGTKLSKLDATKNGAGQLVVSFPAYANVSYVLQSSPDLAAWSDDRLFPGASTPQTPACTNPMAEPARFFRLRLDLD
ncbi:MAG: hypothetical protein EXS35_12690 [Pedosphaera sp.]|nr:hypothetical protein [Pedosphaera sp.]